MVTKATPDMLPRMNELWSKYFGDSVEYSSFFFEQHLKGKTEYENQFVYLENGQVASMLTVIGEVLKYVLDLAKKENVIVGLVPANDGLYHYYSKFGFETFFYKKVEELTIFPEENDTCKLETADPSCYKQLRDKVYHNENYIVWDEHAVKYALQENENSGGKAYICENTGYFLLVCPVGETLIVRETNLPQQSLQSVCNFLGKQFRWKKARIVTCSSSKVSGTPVKHGMICYGDELLKSRDNTSYVMESETGYIGLALD